MSETPKQAARRLSAKAIAQGFKPQALHEYRDADGNIIYRRMRLKHPDGRKWIRPMSLNGHGYELGEPDFPHGKPLYRLPDLIGHADDPAWFVEGENCADALAKLGILATTSGGADSANHADFSMLAQRSVTVWPDNDEPGLRHAREVADRLIELGSAVRLIDVSKLNLPDKGDVVDWLRAHPDAASADLDALPMVAYAKAKPERVAAEDWPDPLNDDAYHGLAGDIVRTIAPHTESDPAAILIQLLTAFGNCIGVRPHYRVEGSLHAANLFVALVGNTSKSRKGTSWGRVTQLFRLIEDPWIGQCVQSGLSSGEGLIWAVRDPIIKRVRKGKGANAYMEDEEIDAGVSDKRLLVTEEEFASTLRVMGREGNTLSPILRKSWDEHRLSSMTKNSPACATGAHISIVGHITVDELRRYLTRTEMGNGFANRFLFVCVRRARCLPDGGNLTDDALRPYAARLAQVIGRARTIERVTMDDDARRIWHAVYPKLSEGLSGLLGAVTSRAEAQVIRLALLYALLDESAVIQPAHLRAGLAIWEYAESSARYIFGSAMGDPVADEIYRALRAAPDGLNRTDISQLFKRHKDRETIGVALESLRQEHRAKTEQRKTDGRPVEVWFAC